MDEVDQPLGYEVCTSLTSEVLLWSLTLVILRYIGVKFSDFEEEISCC